MSHQPPSQPFNQRLLGVAAAGVVAGNAYLHLLPSGVAALLIGALLFFVPGALCLGSDGRRTAAELPAAWFAISSALLLLCFAATLALGGSARAALLLWACATALIAWLRGAQWKAALPTPWTKLTAATALACLLIAVGAGVTLTGTGSIDRWWYLAYVEGWLGAERLSLAEPFLGTGNESARFGLNPWLSMMALWADASGVRPVNLYETFAPVLLLPTALSAAFGLGRSVFGTKTTAALVPLSSVLFWSGALIPAFTRAPEDKFVALLILFPVVASAALDALAARSESTDRQGLALLACAVVGLASCHALVFALVLAALWLPCLVTLAKPEGRNSGVMACIVILGIGTLLAGSSGSSARQQWVEAGAVAGQGSHPVVRIHANRGRSVAINDDNWMVDPKLLANPLIVMSAAGLVFTPALGSVGAAFLIGSSATALAIAFIPPLAAAVGAMILPWMVYRLLWILPTAMLLALALQRSAELNRRLGILLLGLAIGFGAFSGWTNFALRTGGARAALATPRTPEFQNLSLAIRALPTDSRLVTAAELAERVPGLSGRWVFAASERATTVFSGSHHEATERMRARAAILGGLAPPDQSRAPSHLLTEPGSTAGLACGEPLYESPSFQLCTYDETRLRRPPAVEAIIETASPAEPRWLPHSCQPQIVARNQLLILDKAGPWSARPARAECLLPQDLERSGGAELNFAALLGDAEEEFLIVISHHPPSQQEPTWSQQTWVTLRSGERARIPLSEAIAAEGPDDKQSQPSQLRVEINASRLAFLKIRELSLSTADIATK